MILGVSYVDSVLDAEDLGFHIVRQGSAEKRIAGNNGNQPALRTALHGHVHVGFLVAFHPIVEDGIRFALQLLRQTAHNQRPAVGSLEGQRAEERHMNAGRRVGILDTG